VKTGLETRLSYGFFALCLLSLALGLWMLGLGLWLHKPIEGSLIFLFFLGAAATFRRFSDGLFDAGREKDIEREQRRCTDIANTLPVVWGWGGDDPKPWRCIITEDEEAGPDHYGDWYCDQCPAQKECPYPDKRWSQ
jgi:hypothetical protein